MQPFLDMPLYDIIVNSFLFISLYFEVFLLMCFLEKGRSSDESGSLQSFPKATIIVPCYNEAGTIERTVNSLLALNYPKDKFEIFVVDDGSTDNSWNVLQQFANNPMIHLFQKKNGGKHTALNLGLKYATGDIIGCLDSDTTVAPDALTEIVKVFNKDPNNKAVTASIIVREPKTFLQYMQSAEYSLAIFLRKALSTIDGTFVTPGPFSFFRREVFATLGEYREAHNTEDLEIALRMQSNRMRITDAPRARVYTKTPKNLRALLKQRVRWIYGFLKNFMDYRFMLFKPKYGHVGMMVLPMAFFSIFTAIFFFVGMLGNAADAAATEIVKLDTVGLYGSLPHSVHLDWFYLYTEAMMFIIVALVGLTLFLIMIGKNLSGESRIPGYDVFIYFLLYGFVAPLWLTKAVWDAAWSRKPVWTEERKG